MHKVSKKAFYQGSLQAFAFAPPKRKRTVIVVKSGGVVKSRVVVKSGGVVTHSGFEEDRLNLASDWEKVSSDMQAAVKHYESEKLDKASG